MEQDQNNKITPEQINEAVDFFFDFLSSVVGNIASNIAPLLTGLMPAYLTYIHITEVLGFPNWVGLSGAGVIELMGLGAGNELMKVWHHNRKNKDVTNKMPIMAPGAAAVWYIAIMVAFNIILDAFPNSMFWKIASIALFATLAVPGYALVAGKTLRREWELEHFRVLSERKAERKAEREREREERNRADGANDQNSPREEEQLEYASAYAEQIESILERIWQGTGKVATPAYIVRVLNENGARLDSRKSSGYISTLVKNWRISRGIQEPIKQNGNGA